MHMHPVFRFLDPYLIWFYRLTGQALADFLIGTFVLAFIALIIGEYTISLAFLAAKKRIDQVTAESSKYQNLSIDALKAGDKETYKAANRLANDAFGKSFFLQIALSAAFLWPVFLALAWMQYRFLEVEFPIPYTNYSLGYIGVFLIIYVIAYIMFKKVKYRLPFLRRIKPILDSYKNQAQEMRSLADLSLPDRRRKSSDSLNCKNPL